MCPEQFFKCLSDTNRLKVVLLLQRCTEACVCDLMDALEIDQPKVSRNLAELRRCGILRAERRGKWVYYMLEPNLPKWQSQVIESTAQGCVQSYSEELRRLQSAVAVNCL